MHLRKSDNTIILVGMATQSNQLLADSGRPGRINTGKNIKMNPYEFAKEVTNLDHADYRYIQIFNYTKHRVWFGLAITIT